jgi:phosphoadenosine phosphosulfate reductase
MSIAEEIRQASVGMTAPEFLRYLLVDRFPRKTAVTGSLRARSIVVLNMIAGIDPATRVIFCHAPDLYPESVEYRDRIIKRLQLTDVRIAGNDQTGAPPDAPRHAEDIWSDVWGGGRVHSVLHLDQSLAGFDCWVSAVYHRPYGDDRVERVADEGDLVRVDPLSGWNEETVRGYMAEHDLPPHPHVDLKQPRPSLAGTAAVPTYHY